MEDAVTFLESAKKVYPDVALLLNKIQLLALDKDPNEPFTDQVWHACGYLGARIGFSIQFKYWALPFNRHTPPIEE